MEKKQSGSNGGSPFPTSPAGRVKRKHGIIQCLKCNDIIESTHVHDFKYCKCGSVFVDGGSEYLRYGWPEGDPKEFVKVIQDPCPAIPEK